VASTVIAPTGPNHRPGRLRTVAGLCGLGAVSLLIAVVLVSGSDGTAAPTRGSAMGAEPVASVSRSPADPRRDVLAPVAPDRAAERDRPAAGRAPLPVRVEVPSIGVTSTLIELDLDADRHLEVPDDAAVAGWYVRAPRPGEDGPAIIAGHVDSHRGPGVFWRLRELVRGDRIVVHRVDGSSVEFTVEEVQQWPKDRFPTDAVYRQADGPELRLITCGGAFDAAAGSYRDNVIVFAGRS
jgi:sortase (surface protein transpeptidase)